MSTSCLTNTANPSATALESFCRELCRRSLIGSRRSNPRVKARSSKLLSLHLLEFVVAGAAEAAQQIDRAVDSHFAQLDEALVRLQIGVEDFSGNVFCAID